MDVLAQLSKATPKSKPTPQIVAFYDPDVAGGDIHGRTHQEILGWSDRDLERSHDYIQWLFPLSEGSVFNYNAPIVNARVLEAFRSSPILQRRLNTSLMRMLRFYGFTISSRPRPDGESGNGNAAEHEVDTASPTDSEETTEANENSPPQDQISAAATDNNAGPAEANESSESSASGTGAGSTATDQALPAPLDVPDYDIIRGPNWDVASRNWAVPIDHNHLRITRILRSLRLLGLEKECNSFYQALKHTFDDPKIRIGQRSMKFWTRAVTQPLYIAPDGERVGWLRDWLEKDKVNKERKV